MVLMFPLEGHGCSNGMTHEYNLYQEVQLSLAKFKYACLSKTNII